MIAAYLKKTWEIDMKKPLELYIKDNYGKEGLKEMSTYLSDLQSLRNSCIIDDKTVSPSTAIPKHISYYKLLNNLDNKFDFGKSGRGVFTKSKAVEIIFQWGDSFRHSKIEKSIELKLEKRSILFNLGALMSLYAVKLSEQEEEGLKKACKYFKESSGVFNYLATQAGDATGIIQNMDVHPDAAKFLSALMLAQAQSCFVDMATRKKASSGLIAKLCIGTSNLYQLAVNIIDKATAFKQWVSKGEYNFRQHCAYQVDLFKAYGAYWESQRISKLDENGVYGKEIAWLEECQRIIKTLTAMEKKHKLIPSLSAQKKTLFNKKVQPRYKEIKKDNDDIYHDEIPKLSSLKKIIEKTNVKATPFEPTKLSDDDDENKESKLDDDPLKNLVPKNVKLNAESIRVELNKKMKSINDECNETTDLARAQLASLGLPASVDCQGGIQKGLPDSVWERIKETQNLGDYDGLQEKYKKIEVANSGNWKILQNDIIAALDLEQNIDNEIRSKIGKQWQRNESSELQKDYRSQIAMIMTHLTTAIETNSKLEKQMSEFEDTFDMLSQEREEIANNIPSVGASKESPEAEAVKVLLDKLSANIDERESLIKEYEKVINKSDIETTLLQKNNNIETVKKLIETELEKVSKKITENKETQESLLNEISTANDKFIAKKDNNPDVLKREEIIHKLNQACDKFKEINRHLTEGLKFYTDLSADYIMPLKQEVLNYNAARESERDLLLADLGTNVAKLDVNLTGKPRSKKQQKSIDADSQQPGGQMQGNNNNNNNNNNNFNFNNNNPFYGNGNNNKNNNQASAPFMNQQQQQFQNNQGSSNNVFQSNNNNNSQGNFNQQQSFSNNNNNFNNGNNNFNNNNFNRQPSYNNNNNNNNFNQQQQFQNNNNMNNNNNFNQQQFQNNQYQNNYNNNNMNNMNYNNNNYNNNNMNNQMQYNNNNNNMNNQFNNNNNNMNQQQQFQNYNNNNYNNNNSNWNNQ